MRPPLRKLLKALSDSVILPPHVSPYGTSPTDQLGNLELARQEWLTAREYFERTTDPDLVDHAIYQLWASEKKYQYLLKKAREEHLNNDVMDNPWNCLR